jgi:hypothetical protein
VTLPGIIRAISIVLTAIVTISFVSFAWDEAQKASENQLLISRPGGEPAGYARDQHGRVEGLKHSKMRLKIDEISDTATSPAEGIGDSASGGNPWAMRGLAFLFGIALFLFGLRGLARWLELSGSTGSPPPPGHEPGGDDYTPGYR